MSFKQHVESTTPGLVPFKVRVLRTGFGLLVAAGAGVLLYFQAAPAWLAALLIFLGAFFVSQSLTKQFVSYIIKPVAEAIAKAKS